MPATMVAAQLDGSGWADGECLERLRSALHARSARPERPLIDAREDETVEAAFAVEADGDEAAVRAGERLVREALEEAGIDPASLLAVTRWGGFGAG